MSLGADKGRSDFLGEEQLNAWASRAGFPAAWRRRSRGAGGVAVGTDEGEGDWAEGDREWEQGKELVYFLRTLSSGFPQKKKNPIFFFIYICLPNLRS